MPKITISVEDIKSTLTMEAGWKPGTLVGYRTEPSKGRDSINHYFDFSIENEPGDVRKLSFIVNDKNRKMFTIGMIALYEALMKQEVTEEHSIEIEPESWVTLTCFVDVVKGMYNGRPQNSIAGFSAVKPF